MQDQNQDNPSVLEIIQSPESTQQHFFFQPQSLWPRYWALALLALMLVTSLYLYISTNQLYERIHADLVETEDGDAKRIRQYNEKLQTLQDRMTVFVADSVETKLKSLEKNVTTGTVGTQEIKALEELKGEVKLLEKYSYGRHANLTDPMRLDHSRFQIIPSTEPAPVEGDLLNEVSKVKHLLYFSIASCGFVGFMLGGYWWRSHSSIKRLMNDSNKPRLLVATKDSEQ